MVYYRVIEHPTSHNASDNDSNPIDPFSHRQHCSNSEWSVSIVALAMYMVLHPEVQEDHDIAKATIIYCSEFAPFQESRNHQLGARA